MNIARSFSAPQTGDVESDAGAVSMLEIRAFISRQWRLIALATGLSLTVGLIYVTVAPARYTAQADIIIDTKKTTWTQTEMSSESHAIEDAAVESEIETTKSDKVAGMVIQRLHLDRDPEFAGANGGIIRRMLAWMRLPAGPEPRPSDEELKGNVLDAVKDNLRVMRLGRSYIEQIAFTSLDREKAANIANAFADAYIEDQLQAKFEATRRASAWLEQRIGELRQQASDAFKAVQDYKSEKGIIIGVDGKLASEVELDQLGIALAKARADTSQARAKLDRISRVLEHRGDLASLDMPDPVVADALSNPVITKLRQQYLDDQNKESEWSARYGSDHQAAQNLRDEMAALQRAIWDEFSRIAESYKGELQIAKSQENAIEKRMTEVFELSDKTRQSQVHLSELVSAANTYKGIYETFLARFTQTVQQQSFPSTEARVVAPASPPRVRSSPKTTLTLLLATIGGMALGLASAFVREQMRRQIHTRAQLEKLLGLSCLAVLPALGGKSSMLRRLRGKPHQGAFQQLSELPPFSATAEALRYIKVAIDIHFMRDKGDQPKGGKIIGLVSALPGEGKTTVAAGFAAFVAKTGARTLLIDADFRNPSLTRTLGRSGTRGLINIISENARFEDVVVSDATFKFDLVPSSTEIRTSNSSDVLNSPIMQELLRTARDSYEYVLVDLPPILPVVDVMAVAHLLDAFLLVVEWGSTPTDEILKAVKTSSLVAERLIGAILNKADETVMRRLEGYSDRRYGYYTK